MSLRDKGAVNLGRLVGVVFVGVVVEKNDVQDRRRSRAPCRQACRTQSPHKFGDQARCRRFQMPPRPVRARIASVASANAERSSATCSTVMWPSTSRTKRAKHFGVVGAAQGVEQQPLHRLHPTAASLRWRACELGVCKLAAVKAARAAARSSASSSITPGCAHQIAASATAPCPIKRSKPRFAPPAAPINKRQITLAPQQRLQPVDEKQWRRTRCS